MTDETHIFNQSRYDEEFAKLPKSRFFDETSKMYALDYWAGPIGFTYHVRLTDLGFWNLTRPCGTTLKGFGYKSLMNHFAARLTTEIKSFSDRHNVPSE
jgi:hypothetical protein